jgi:3-deoxy-D-manno-octulosonate 8-phosphate phosphatase (KDO 8-P phosphatase)
MKILIMDIDGCLTDGHVYVNEKGKETRKYHTYDSMMLNYWDKVYLITREKNKSHYKRFKKLNKKHKNIFFIRTDNKPIIYFRIRWLYTKDEIDFIGDDVSDLYIMQGREFSYVPKDSVIDILLNKIEKTKLGIITIERPVIPNILKHKKYKLIYEEQDNENNWISR